MKLRQIFGILLIVLFISGCTGYKPSVPKNYNGPIANIKDSAIIHSSSKVDFFYLEKINQNEILNSRIHTLNVNHGRGLSFKPVVLDHNIPAKESTITLVGRTEYAAPIQALTNTVYEIKGDITFIPNKNKKYIIKGKLDKQYSSVWIEELESSIIVGNKIELNGSSALSFFEK
jgi:hypothetical protein